THRAREGCREPDRALRSLQLPVLHHRQRGRERLCEIFGCECGPGDVVAIHQDASAGAVTSRCSSRAPATLTVSTVRRIEPLKTPSFSSSLPLAPVSLSIAAPTRTERCARE